MLIRRCCLCGGSDFHAGPVRFDAPMNGDGRRRSLFGFRCRHDDAVHQHVEMTPEEYLEFYASGAYHDCYQATIGRQTYAQRYDHDREIARLRLARYRLPPGASILDVGAGNAAFVDEANTQGFDAWGIEPGIGVADHEHVISAAVEHVQGLSLDPWQVITLHDVLEHLIDPALVLAKLRRAAAQLILDWPDFWAPDGSGAHHWREIQHLWLLTGPEVMQLLANAGWRVAETWVPIPGKLVFRCE